MLTHGSGPSGTQADIVLAATASDSHTWNLVFLHLRLAELGHRVRNLGPCVPNELLVDTCRAVRPRLVVLSSVNGHGAYDGVPAVQALRRCPELAEVPIVIGGLLGVTGKDTASQALLAAGFDAVFGGAHDLPAFEAYIGDLPAGTVG